MNKTFRRIVRRSVVFLGLWAVYWGAYYLIDGSIPTTSVISIWATGWVIQQLPFSVSRLYDALVIPISVAIYALGVSLPEVQREFAEMHRRDWFISTVWLALWLGFLDGLFTGALSGIATAVISCIGAVLVVCIVLIIRSVVRLGQKVYSWTNT